jgi:hypothetical protein
MIAYLSRANSLAVSLMRLFEEREDRSKDRSLIRAIRTGLPA